MRVEEGTRMLILEQDTYNLPDRPHGISSVHREG
jgi:hypothetical protein